MNDQRHNDTLRPVLLGFLIGALTTQLLYWIFFEFPFDKGVRAHAAGTAVIVDLPNGESIVVRVPVKESQDVRTK